MNSSLVSLIKPYESIAYLDDDKRRHFSINGPLSHLLFYGSHHVREAEHPMFEEIRKLFDSAQPDLIFVEGLPVLRQDDQGSGRASLLEEVRSLSIQEAIRHFGERGFCIVYALARGIGIECPEPAFEEELRYVEQQSFSCDAIVGYYVYRMVHQWLNTPRPPDLKDYLSPVIAELQKTTRWSDYDWSFSKIAALSELFWNAPVTLDSENFYLKGISPCGNRENGTGTETNEVSSASAFFRDLAIAQEIIGAQTRAKSIAVVYGSGHAFTLEEALTDAFRSGRTCSE